MVVLCNSCCVVFVALLFNGRKAVQLVRVLLHPTVKGFDSA
jgi:hypothetical protein